MRTNLATDARKPSLGLRALGQNEKVTEKDLPEQNKASLRSSAARGGGVMVLGQGLRILVLALSTIVLARLIDPESFGLVAMTLAFVGLAQIFRDLGLSVAALRTPNLTQGQQSNLFWINAALGLVLTVVVYLLAWPIAGFYGDDRLVGIVQALSVTYVLGGCAVQFRVAINRSLRWVALTLSDLMPQVIGFIVAAIIAVYGYGIAALVAQQIIAALVTLVMTVSLARWWPGLPGRRRGTKPLIKFGTSFATTQLLGYFTRNVDSIAIGNVWGASPLGLYDRAYQLAVVPLTQLNAPLSQVAIPVLSRVIENKERFAAAIRESQLISVYVTSSVLFLIAGLGTPIIVVFLGEEWLPSGILLSVLAVSGVFRSLTQISFWIFASQGKARSQLYMQLVGQPIVVICLLLGLPWGALGVAVGGIVGYIGFWVLGVTWAARVSGLVARTLLLEALATILMFGAPAGLAAWAIAEFAPVSAIVAIMLGIAAAIAWYGLAWMLFPRIRRDVKVLVRFVKAAVKRTK